MSDVKEGWAMPSNSKKYHFFVDSRSLCGKWAFFGALQTDDGKADSGDCKGCRSKLVKRMLSHLKPGTLRDYLDD